MNPAPPRFKMEVSPGEAVVGDHRWQIVEFTTNRRVCRYMLKEDALRIVIFLNRESC